MSAPDAALAYVTRPALPDRVLPLLLAAGVAAAFGSAFVTVAPNRLVSGHPIALFAAADPRLAAALGGVAVLLLATAVLPLRSARHRAAAALVGMLLVLVPATAGQAAAMLAAGAPPLARVSLGAGFWIMFGAAALALIDALQRAGAGIAERLFFAAAIVGALAALAAVGVFDALSLVREYQAQRAGFAAALVRHIVLVVGSVGPAVAIGLPLGTAAVRRPKWQGPLFATLNLLQTIPSIALFGLLLAPLSALATAVPALAAVGVGGVGMAPALIALVLYALLPVVRNTVAGIAGVDPAVVDAARGMGMTPRQRLWRVEFALALPLLIAGLRIVTVQAIGLAVVAALIGAGGLGTFVFAGLGQYATDLVLLGALPAILLALGADFLLQALAGWAARR